MQKAEHILSLLGQKTKDRPDFVFKRVYRYLYHPDLYVKAMEKNAGSNRSELMGQVDALIQQLRMERCDWHHPLSAQLLKDAITILLQSLYQPLAFPCLKQSRKAALMAIQSIPPPFGWWIELPAGRVFQQVPPERFGFMLKQKISDGRFLRCVQKLIQIHGWPVEWISILLQEFDQWLINQPEEITYIRYQDHMFLLVRGAKADAQALIERIHRFMQARYGIEAFAQDAHIHCVTKKRLRFAEYELRVVANRRIGIFVPKTKVDACLRLFQKQGKPKAFSARIYLPIERIIALYRKERREFETFCSVAWNRRKQLKYFRYVHFSSLVKTIARKQNLSAKQVRKRYRKQLQQYLT